MTRSSTCTIVAVSAHARDVDATERGRFAAGLRERLDGGILLETCHRVDAYVAVPSATPDDELTGSSALAAGGRLLVGDEAVRHIVTVAVGGDSVVIGEDQILHQLRAALESARRSGSLDRTLERLLALALQAGRQARSWRSGPRRSLADVALERIAAVHGPLQDREVLVVGAGRMGALTARAARAAGAVVSVANRSPGAALRLASETGSRVVPLDPGADAGRHAGIVVALAGPWPIGPAAQEALSRGSTVIVDLSVPSAVPEALAAAAARRFIDADELARIDPPGAADARLAERRARLVDVTTARFLEWQSNADARAAADALVRASDREREAELAALWRRLPDLDPSSRDAIEAMSRHLAARLLREPLRRLGRDGSPDNERAVRELFSL